MARVAVQIETVEVGRGRSGRAARLFRITSDRLASVYRRSRERDELAAAISLTRIGRETGVKC